MSFEPANAQVGGPRKTAMPQGQQQYAGAQRKGIFAVRYAGVYDDPGSATEGTDVVEGDAVITDHADLLAALGIS